MCCANAFYRRFALLGARLEVSAELDGVRSLLLDMCHVDGVAEMLLGGLDIVVLFLGRLQWLLRVFIVGLLLRGMLALARFLDVLDNSASEERFVVTERRTKSALACID